VSLTEAVVISSSTTNYGAPNEPALAVWQDPEKRTARGRAMLQPIGASRSVLQEARWDDMSRVERFRQMSRATAKKRAPWAERIVSVDGIHVAYENAQDAEEQHGAISGIKPLWDGANVQVTLQEARDHLARKARGRASKAKGDAWESEVIAKAKACGWLVVQL